MKKRILHFRMMVKVVMIGLLLGVAKMTNVMAQTITVDDLIYSLNYNNNGVTVIGHVNGMAATGSLSIPESILYDNTLHPVTAIGENAFNCSSFTGELNLPNTITRIEGGAFSNSGFSGNLSLPNSITHIGYDAFSFCGFAGNLEIPNSVIEIGPRAFCWCEGISSITIPNSIGLIGGEAFQYTGWYNNQPDGMLYLDGWCLGYKEIQPTGTLTFQDGTIGIAGEAFFNCTELTGILTIPETIRSIGDFAFYGCTGLTELHFNAVQFNYISGNYPFMECNGLTTLVIGNSVESIPDYIFSDVGFTGNLIIPNSVTSIGNGAFQGCSGFTGELVIPSSVTSIGSGAFYSCRGFTGELIIPNSVTTIKGYAFYDCNSLTSVTIPNSVTLIGEYAFAYCSGLEGMVVEANNPIYDSRDNCNAIIMTSTNELAMGCKNTVIPNSVISIGHGAFSGCSELTGNIIIPESVTMIGAAAFYKCSGLISITIPNSVTTIGNNAFSECISMTGRIIIPKSVIFLGGGVFNKCSGLTEMIILGTIPPSLGWGAYLNTSFPIYVPYESLNEYKNTTYWNNYESRIYPMSYKSIPSYNESNGNWQFIASPLAESIAPTEIEDMIPITGAYDLYRFDQSENAEWRNYKANSFNLVNAQGYLYANADDVNLIFMGEFNEEETKEVSLVYDANAALPGWNLVGNPFPVNAYTNRSYYVMNEDGTAIEPVAVSMETAIPPCTGVMVKADNAGETVTFSKTMPEMVPNQGNIQIAVMQTNKSGVSMMDKAIVSFNAGDKLEKFVFNEDNAQLYIPSGKNNYVIACAKKTGEMPLNFKAHKNGIYTITVDTEKTEMEYLHIIDNLTGNDVDLLAETNYTFEARPTDYASRFKLVFSANEEDGASTGSETFAFVNNGNIIITTDAFDASLQVIDMLGRVLVCRDALRASAISTTGMPPGVYVLRLISGDDVRTQKIVVR